MSIIVTPHVLNLVKEEKKMLRDELKGLKKCQIKFLTGAVVSVGVILGLPGVFRSPSVQDFIQSAYLAPLVVLIPCWWGFFDKAKSITRIVGYFRVLEQIAVVENGGTADGIERFLGWENSVSHYRTCERNGQFKSVKYRKHPPNIREIVKALFLIPSQRYWSLAHYSYLVLSALCVMVSLVGLWGTPGHYPSKAVLALAAFGFAYSLVWNTAILWALMWGRHSYAATVAYWRDILGPNIQAV
jgi:hypothetical protein